jgi:ABC-type multidrug transport system fused ATPase/permease subunit
MSQSIDLIKKFTDEHAGLMVAYFFINIFTLALEAIIMSILLSKIFTAFEKKGNIKNLFMMFIGVFILVRLGHFLRIVVYDEIIPKFFYFLRTELYDKIIDRYRVDYKELNTGYVLFNFEKLPISFKKLMTQSLQEYIPDVLAMLVCICYLFYTNKIVGGIVLLGIIVFGIILALTLNNSIELSKKQHLSFQNDNEHIHDRLSNLFDIYTSGTENVEKQEFDDLERNLEQSMTINYKYVTTVISIMEVFIILVLVSILCILYNAYLSKSMTHEYIISTILVLTYFLTYFSKIAYNYIGLTDVFGYAKESDRFLKEINGTVPQNISPKSIFLNGPIEFKNVSFKYPDIENIKTKKILNGTSLYIKPGSKIAIYGKSGSGKSTLIKLLLGFYELDSGSITINGVNIKDIEIEELRKNISVVNQNIKLFDKTIFENMIYGSNDDNISEEDIEQIIGNPNIFGNVTNGLNAEVGTSGSKLSGGQKQITSIVRSLLKNTPILILDEPTSALDHATKKTILNIIKKLKGKTVIIITHDKDILPYIDKSYELIGGELKMM